jgi:hypothetical protein
MLAPPKPPTYDELEALIKEARARQLRRRLLGAAGVAITAALGLGIYAFLTGGSPANLAQPSASGGRVTGPPCRATQLSASAGLQGATQSLLGGATITNTGNASCSLPQGRPFVRFSLDGKALRVRERSWPYRFTNARPVHVLLPHGQAVIYLQWWNWCGKTGPTSVQLRFGHDLNVPAPEAVGEPTCIGTGLGPTSTLYVSPPLPPNSAGN